MSTFLSGILSGTKLNASTLKTVLDSKLPVSYYNESWDTADSVQVSSSTPANFDNVGSVIMGADDLILVISSLSWSASDVTDEWNLDIDIAGTTQNTARQFLAETSATDGKQSLATVVGVFTNETAGTKQVNIRGYATGTPSGTMYSDNGDLHILIFKRR